MTVRVVYGVNDETLSLAGCTVGFAAHSLRDVFNIPLDTDCLLNGDPATTEDLLATGDLLEFVQQWGRKGCGSEYLSVTEVRRMVGDKGIGEMRGEGITPKNIPVYETEAVLRWVNKRLELDAAIVKEREAVSARGLTVDPDTRQATFKTRKVDLTEKPFELLYLLVREFRPGRKHEIGAIKFSVWRDGLTSDDTVRRTISRLRKALEKFPGVQLTLADMRVELSIE